MAFLTIACPPDALQRDIDAIVDMGVELRLNHPVDDVVALKDEGYDAIFLGVGAHRGVKVPIEGEGVRS